MQKQATKARATRATRNKKAEQAAKQAEQAATETTETTEQAATNLPATIEQTAQSDQRDDSAQAETAEKAEPSKAEQIADQRRFAATVFGKLCDSVSIPIKTLAAFKLNTDLQPHANGRKPSKRQAAAIAVAVAASGQKTLANGTTFARSFTLNGASYAIENGAGSDMLRAGLVTYDRASESFTITSESDIRAQLGKAVSAAFQ